MPFESKKNKKKQLLHLDFFQDINWLLSRLPNVRSAICLSGFGHFDFVYVIYFSKYFYVITDISLIFEQGKNAKEKVYAPIIALLPPP